MVSGHFFDSSPPCVSNVISNCLPERRHICNSCIYLAFFLCGHNCLPGRMQGHTRYTFLNFLQYVFLNVSSNSMPGRMHSHTSCIFRFFIFALVAFFCFSPLAVRFQMSQRNACLREGIFAIVAFIWLSSTVPFQMSGQFFCLEGCQVTLGTFVWLFSSVFFKCVLKWHDREDAKSHKLQ